MPRVQANPMLRLVRDVPAPPDATDRELLRRFAGGDQPAMAALVARHTPMVLGVCQRTLANRQDAEDACQAVFLVLARKAAARGWQPSIANWLYTTARRVAARALRSRARRRRHESEVDTRAPGASPLDQMTGREAFAALDAELERLPAAYREPLVLCCLEGLSREEAAARLASTPGAVKAGLERGRKRLTAALARRGITFGAAVLAATTGNSANAAIRKSILNAVAGSPAPAVARLARESAVTRAFLSAKLLAAAIVLGAFSLIDPAPDGLAPPPRAVAAPVPKEADTDLIWTYQWPTGTLIGFTPDGKRAKEITVKDQFHLLAITPDGQSMLFAGKNGKVPDEPGKVQEGLTLHIRPLGPGTTGKDLGLPLDPTSSTDTFRFTADGKKLVCSTRTPGRGALDRMYTHTVVDLTTNTAEALIAKPHDLILDVSPDGTWVVAVDRAVLQRVAPAGAPPAPPAKQQLFKIPMDGSDPVVLAERQVIKHAAISRDGKTVVFSGTVDRPWQEGVYSPDDLLKVDVATRKVESLAAHPMQSDTEPAWSLDGKRIAYLWTDVSYDKEKNTANFQKTHIVVCDLTGKDAKTWLVYDQKTRLRGLPKLLGWFPNPTPKAAAGKSLLKQ